MGKMSTTVQIGPNVYLFLSVGKIQKTPQITHALREFEKVCSGVPGASNPQPGKKLCLVLCKLRETYNTAFPRTTRQEKMQEMFNKNLEELKNKHLEELNNKQR